MGEGSPRARNNINQSNPNPQAQVAGMEEMEIKEGGRDNLSYKDIRLMEGDDDHLLEGQNQDRV